MMYLSLSVFIVYSVNILNPFLLAVIISQDARTDVNLLGHPYTFMTKSG